MRGRIIDSGRWPLAGTWRLETDGPYDVMVCRTAAGHIVAMMHPDDYEAICAEYGARGGD